MTPTICRLVRYTLTATDAEQINRRRTTPDSIRQRIHGVVGTGYWSLGAQAHIGLEAREGDVLPALIVFVDPVTATVDAQVFLRGNDVLFVAGIYEGPDDRDVAGAWRWPPRS